MDYLKTFIVSTIPGHLCGEHRWRPRPRFVSIFIPYLTYLDKKHCCFITFQLQGWFQTTLPMF